MRFDRRDCQGDAVFPSMSVSFRLVSSPPISLYVERCPVSREGYINIEQADESENVIDCYLSHEHPDQKEEGEACRGY